MPVSEASGSASGPALRTPRADSAATRERLLAASLRLFSERGYAGTSVRAITDDAGVNLAAANYHFGSKQQLLEATFQSALAPINAERIRRLEALESTSQVVGLTELVTAFVEPLFLGSRHKHLPKLLANVFAEPKDVAVPLLQSTFGPIVDRFLAAFAKALPQLDRNDLQWRLHLLVGAMLQLAHFGQPLFVDMSGEKADPAAQPDAAGIQQLVRFAVAGLQQDAELSHPGGAQS